MLQEISIFVLSAFLLILIYSTWYENYWLKNKIPYIAPKKFFGNVRDVIFMKKTIGEVYQEIYNKLGDKPLGGFFILRKPILMIKHRKLIKEVLVKQFDHFQANDIRVRRDTSPILKMNPLLTSGATWRSMKSVLLPLSSQKTLNSMIDYIKIISNQMLKGIETKGHTIDAKVLSAKYVSDVIASCALGMDPLTLSNPDSKYREMTQRIFKNSFKRNIALLFALYAPNLANLFHYRIVPKKISNYFITLLSDLCKYRVKENIEREDFLQYLIDVNKESEASGEGTVFNYDKITGHCMTVFIDGYFMTQTPLYYCLYDIANHEKVQENIRNELKLKGILTINDLSGEKLDELVYLDAVILESLRLHPPIQTITRLCTEKTTLLHDGLEYTIEKGIPVTIPVVAVHQDPKNYNEPQRFKPERFEDDLTKFSDDCIYLPFGAGPRKCPGEKFANLILKMALTSILLHFILSPGNFKKLSQDPLSSFLNTARGEVMITFKPII